MSRSEDPSSRSVPPRKKTAAEEPERAAKAPRKAKAARKPEPQVLDSDFGLALRLVPAVRRPPDA